MLGAFFGAIVLAAFLLLWSARSEVPCMWSHHDPRDENAIAGILPHANFASCVWSQTHNDDDAGGSRSNASRNLHVLRTTTPLVWDYGDGAYSTKVSRNLGAHQVPNHDDNCTGSEYKHGPQLLYATNHDEDSVAEGRGNASRLPCTSDDNGMAGGLSANVRHDDAMVGLLQVGQYYQS
ncbi:hypothetical protein EDB92DRAFT_1992026 [Lactarius akahatsu]|uniref:Uncharacterized protein n=1 Tax=Lactarius akahatsu TaxID=416441 RepID=A0AAD4L4V4_9AGAM|nr:hypothetical protein EDB92DRAFT_1992026 [Lactarius akahatsu]